MIALAPEHPDLVRRIAAAQFPGATLLVFGSRARGTALFRPRPGRARRRPLPAAQPLP